MRTLKQDFIKGLFLIVCLLLLDNSLLIISTIILIYLLFTPIYINILNKFRSDDILIIKKEGASNLDLFNIAIGLIIAIWGFYKNDTSNPIYLNGKYILALFLIINGFFNSRKYLFIITRKSIIFNDGFLMSDWKLKFLDSINLHKDKVEFIKLPQKMSFDFINNPNEIVRIDKFLETLDKVKITKETMH